MRHAAWWTWSAIAADRSEWRCRCYESIQQFEVDRVYAAEDKWTRRKAATRLYPQQWDFCAMYMDATVHQRSVAIHIVALTSCDDEIRRVNGSVGRAGLKYVGALS